MKLILLTFATLFVSSATFASTATFKMYHDSNARVSPLCDVYTELNLDIQNRSAVATLTNKVEGVCDIVVDPNKRTYELELSSQYCGTKTYTFDDGADSKVTLTDNRGRRCEDVIPALIVVSELSRNHGTENILYSKD